MIDRQLEKFISDSESELSKIQKSLEDEKIKIMLYLEERLLNKFELKNIIISGRVKKASSLKEKIIRKTYAEKYKTSKDFIDELPDIIGIRLVCLLKKEEDLVFNTIKKCFSKIGEDENFFSIPGNEAEEQYLEVNHVEIQPQRQKNNMEIYKLTCKWISDTGKTVNVELQIKSLIHMFWGEIEHMLFYKNYSYTIGANFYIQIMDSIYETLSTVDSQLGIMKRQMRASEIKEQIDEIKQMLAKLMYNNYSPKLNEFLKCEIDLREIYDLIIEIQFREITSIEEAINKLNIGVSNINSQCSQLSESTFNLEVYNRYSVSIAENSISLAIIVDDLTHSKDIFWRILIGLYGVCFNINGYSKIVSNISDKLMNLFIAFNDYIEVINEDESELLRDGIYIGILEAFKRYRKIDFFLPQIHNNNILEILKKFLNHNQEDFDIEQDEFIENKKEKTKLFVGLIVSLYILSEIGESICREDLLKLQHDLDDDMILWKPEVNNCLLESIITEKRVISKKDFKNIFEV